MWPAVNEGFTQGEFVEYVRGLKWGGWRPSGVVWHNTALPTLVQWQDTAAKDKAAGRKPGITRMENLERFYRRERGWSGSPHLFIADDLIWVANPLTARGVHSPSFNSTRWGFEMVGDFSKEDPHSGPGLRVKNNTILATAALFEAIGLEPGNATVAWHREDPRTTHRCPGDKIIGAKGDMLAAVRALMDGGDHAPDTCEAPEEEPAQAPAPEQRGKVRVDGLNFRRGPGVSNEATGSLPAGTELAILDRARNGETEWLKVRTPAGYVGWVSGRYVDVET